MIHFKSESSHKIAGRGLVKMVKNPITCDEWAWIDDYGFLIGSTVDIDGEKFKVMGVETFAYAGNRRVGETIGLLIRKTL